MKLICVILKEETPYQYEDTINLFDYGFGNFQIVNIAESDSKYAIDNANFFSTNNDIFGSSKPILSLNKDDHIILPNTADPKDVESSISYDVTGENQIASINYTYNGVAIGSVSVDLATDSVFSYQFDSAVNESEPENVKEPGENIIFINVKTIIFWVLGIAGVLIGIFILRAVISNYHFSRRRKRYFRRNRRHYRNFRNFRDY